MKVLGIDQASHTGFAVVDDGKIVDSGTVIFKGHVGKRISEFTAWLRHKIREELPDMVVYEKPHFRGYAATLSGVGLISAILVVAYELGVRVESVHTATLKKFATGYGKASKAAMTGAANTVGKLSLNTKNNNDEADAIHLALYGSTYLEQ